MSAFGLFGSCVTARVLCQQARRLSAVGGMSVHRSAPCSRYLFDFARKTRSDMASRHAPVAWYDEAGYGFFSRATAHSHRGLQPPTVAEAEALGIHRRSTFDMAAVIGAHRCVPSAYELRVFREKEASLALGNVKLGWYGAMPEAVTTSAAAFQRPNWALPGADSAPGRGLHLYPLRFSRLSMGIAEANYEGVAHGLLRLFVQGLPAAISAGSDQSYTTENELKSSFGVELLSNQIWSVIWCENMNRFSAVSFKKRPMLCDLGPLPSCIPVAVDEQKLHRGVKRLLSSCMLQKLEDYFDSDMVVGILFKMGRTLKLFKTSGTPILVGADVTSKVLHVQKAVPLSKKTAGIRQVNPWSAYRCRKRSHPYGAAKQFYRSYSTAKSQLSQDNAVNNTYVFSLNGDGHEILENFRGLIGWIRTSCRFHGQTIDVSQLYGPGREVFTTPVDGTMHITVKHKERSLTLILAGRDLYIKGWRCKNGTFELKPDVEGQYYTTGPNRTVLSFSCNYKKIGADIGNTRIGQSALESAFDVLYKSKGKGSDKEKNAVSIFAVNICEAARFQTIFRLVCESFWEFSVTQLDSQSKISRQTHKNSWWVRQWSYYSGQAMEEIDLLLKGKEPPGIVNRGGGTIKSASEIISVIRILLQSKYLEGEFAYRRLPPEIAKESPPNAEGASLTPLSSVLNDWNFEDPENGSQEDDEAFEEDTEYADQMVDKKKQY